MSGRDDDNNNNNVTDNYSEKLFQAVIELNAALYLDSVEAVNLPCLSVLVCY